MSSGLTSPYLLPYPLQTDPVDVASDVEDLAVAVNTQLLLKSPILSPTFTGVASAVTAGLDTNTTQIATTQFVISQGYLKTSTASSTYAALASPTFTGNPLAPTQTFGDNSTRIATTAFVTAATLAAVPGVGSITSTQIANNTILDEDINSTAGIAQTKILNLVSDLASKAPLNLSFNSQVGTTYSLQLSDSARQIEMNNSSANTVVVPTDASKDFPIGTTIVIVQIGTGQTSVVAESVSITVNSTPGAKLRTRWSMATLIKRAPNSWILSGDLIA